MNFISKHILVNLGTRLFASTLLVGAESFLAKYAPEIHENYVDSVVERMDQRIESFILRNAIFAEKFSIEDDTTIESDSIVEDVPANVYDLLARLNGDKK